MENTAHYSTKICLLHLTWLIGGYHDTNCHTSILFLSALTWDPVWGESRTPHQLTSKGCLCRRNQGALGGKKKGAHGNMSVIRYSLMWGWAKLRVFKSRLKKCPASPVTCSTSYFPSWEQPSGGWIIKILRRYAPQKKQWITHLPQKQKTLPVRIF